MSYEEQPARSLMESFQTELNEEAFERIFSRFGGPALGVARKILSDPEKAEDAVQEAFLQVIRKRKQYDNSRDFAPWFYTILRNICTDMLRRQMRSIEHTGHQFTLQRGRADASQHPHSPVQKLMTQLPDNQRTVLELRILHKMRFREIGAALGISEEAAKKRGQRGLRRLRELFFSSPETGPESAPQAGKASSPSPWTGFSP